MKLFASLIVLFVITSISAFVPRNAFALAASPATIIGIWQGFATVGDGQQIPVVIRISGNEAKLKAAFLNGPADHPEETAASTVTFDGIHLVVSFDYFAHKFDAILTDGTLVGTYGTDNSRSRGRIATALKLRRVANITDPAFRPDGPDIHGSWEIATRSTKGEAAWEFRSDLPTGRSHVIKAVIQRIDGDTGGLWGSWNGTSYIVGHFNAAGAALYSVTPHSNGTLIVQNLLGPVHKQALVDLIARRPADARKENLPAPTDSTQQTTVKDPTIPFAFSFPDLTGKVVSNTDSRFRGKVVIVAIGGSWCPNCHDEAPFLVSLYKKYSSRGLEIVNLDFEQGDPETDTSRLRAFIAHYGINYTVLAAGTTDQLAEKIPEGVNLNCWPTTFFLGRDGRVKETHAGFAGPGNTVGHALLKHDVTALVEKLLSEPVPHQATN